MRIVVRCQDARLAREAQTRLQAAGYPAAALPGLPRTAPDGEDIVIAPALDGDLDAASTYAAGAHLLASIAALPFKTPPAAGLSQLKGFTGAIALDGPPAMLAAQLAGLVRVAVIEEEARRRAATATALGLNPSSATAPRRLKALYVGAPSPLFLSLERAFGAHEGVVTAAFSSYAGFDHLHDEPFDAVVLNGAADAATALSLCAALRRNASLYHLPTLVIVAPGDSKTEAAAIARGASAVVAANEPGGASLGWLFEAIRRERRRRAAEYDMRALRDIMGDTRTGLFTAAAFEAHLGRLALDHQESGRPLSLAVLRTLIAPGAREPDAAAWKKGFDEIAGLAGRLMRESDCGATAGEDVIVIAMPAARLKSARRTAERIASVAECTAFAAGDAGFGPLVFEQSCVELQPGESGAGLFRRALHALDADTMSRTGN